MKILVINSGSSSIKYELFDMTHHMVIARGMVEKIGEEQSVIIHRRSLHDKEHVEREESRTVKDHSEAMSKIVDFLTNKDHGVVTDRSEISAVGHRVVHGGEKFCSPVIINSEVKAAIRENVSLAPLHNPANLMGIDVAESVFPDCPQVAVFDTAFHHTMPDRAFLYAVPIELYRDAKVRRYGFHGTSHAYVSEKASEFLQRPLCDLCIITIHLGNGASMAAVKEGLCVDTSMGMTPLEGLVMGTRCGDIDPSIPFYLSDHLDMPFDEISVLLNKRSGLKGLCGENDMREVLRRKSEGDDEAAMAVDVYTYRIKKYIGAYFAAMGRLDAVVFTAGIGENSPEIRAHCCCGLEMLGIEIDDEKNMSSTGGNAMDISSADSRVSVLVVPTNEELRIAIETMALVQVPERG